MAQLDSIFAVGGSGFVAGASVLEAERTLPREEPTALGLAMANAVREAREREEREAAKGAPTVTRRCTRCKHEKPATAEYYTKDRNAPSGLQRWCKTCHSAHDRAKRQREREAREAMRAGARPKPKAATRPLITIPAPTSAAKPAPMLYTSTPPTNPLPTLPAGIPTLDNAPTRPRELDVAAGGERVSLADFLVRAKDKPNAVLIMGRASVRLTEDGTAAWLGTRDGKGSPEAIPLSLVSWALSTVLAVPADTLGVMFS